LSFGAESFLFDEQLNNPYSSPYIIWMIKLRRMKPHMEERRGIYQVLLGKPEGKRPLERRRHRWEDNKKMDQGVG
jgi:hypothetical protein